MRRSIYLWTCAIQNCDIWYLQFFWTLSWDKSLEGQRHNACLSSQDSCLARGWQLTLQLCTCNQRISVREIQYFCCINWVEWLVIPKEGTTDLKNLFPLNVFLSTRPWYHIDINQMYDSQAAICEIRAGRWVRNGSQIRSQVRLYVECHFCNSIQDLDIFLLQVKCFENFFSWFVLSRNLLFCLWISTYTCITSQEQGQR